MIPVVTPIRLLPTNLIVRAVESEDAVRLTILLPISRLLSRFEKSSSILSTLEAASLPSSAIVRSLTLLALV